MLNRPSVLLWIALIAGGAAALNVSGAARVAAVGIAALAIAALPLQTDRPRTVKALLLAALVGYAVCAGWTDAANRSRLPADADGKTFEFAGVIEAPPEIDGDRISLRLRSGWGESFQMFVYADAEAELRQAETWGRGDRISGTGALERPAQATNIGMFDYREWLRRQHVHWTIAVDGAGGLNVEPASAWHPLRSLDDVRKRLVARLDAMFGDRTSGLMAGLLLGERGGIEPDVEQSFRAIGLAHLLAISGLHVGVFVGSLMGLGALLRLPREARLWICIATLPLYVVLTGASVPVIRAGAMAMAGLALVLRRRWKDAPSLLALTGVGMLLWNPYLLLDVGYQLSFGITAALIYAVPGFAKRLPAAWPAWLRNGLAVTLVAQAVSFPLTIYYFNEFSLLSLPANLLIVPLVSFAAIPAGYGALVLDAIWRPAGLTAARAVDAMLDLTIDLLDAANGLLALRTVWASPSPVWIALFVAALGAFAASLSRNLTQRLATAAVLALLTAHAYAPHALLPHASVEFIDVGQGDAILIRFPNGDHWLLDAGGRLSWRSEEERWRERVDPFEPGEDIVVPVLKKRGVHRLDAVFVTHADYDHYGGLHAVLQHMPVKRVYFNGTLKDNETFRELLALALERDIPIVPVRAGMEWTPHGSATVTALAPVEAETIRVEPDQNEHSVALWIRLFGVSFVLSGDLDAAGEKAAIERLGALAPMHEDEIVVLKAGHHGSATSTDPAWLAAWRPDYAVVSAGKGNRYGHPAPEVLSRLEASGSEVLRTDLHGGIRFVVTTKGLSLDTAVALP